MPSQPSERDTFEVTDAEVDDAEPTRWDVETTDRSIVRDRADDLDDSGGSST